LVENFADEVEEMEGALGDGLHSGMMGIFYR
jgi:hypothetical protein